MDSIEIWKEIPGFHRYQVSDFGRVKNVIYHGGKNREIPRDKILKQRYDRHGYFYLALGKGIYRKVHRLVALAFLPNPENKPMINHKNGIKDDNRLENLEWCTHSENAKHAHRTGLWKSPTQIINAAVVRAIRVLISEGALTGEQIGSKFGVTKYTISDIKRRKTWAHVV